MFHMLLLSSYLFLNDEYPSDSGDVDLIAGLNVRDQSVLSEILTWLLDHPRQWTDLSGRLGIDHDPRIADQTKAPSYQALCCCFLYSHVLR
jgi:hypothetical protein